MLQKETLSVKGSDYTLETGAWAKQAGGSVILRWGKVVLMANATAAKKAAENIDFFPLTVEYRERFYATGKIPGGFIKREGRPSDREILVSRLTDRPIRPLFPENYRNELQIFITLLSGEASVASDVHAITVASAALMLSDTPFDGPVAGVRIARIKGEFVLFPSSEELKNSDINLVLAGTEKAVTMIEGLADEVSEEDVLQAVKVGHDEIRRICQAQVALSKKAGKPKAELPPKIDNSALDAQVRSLAFEPLKAANAVHGKHERQEALDKVIQNTLSHFEKEWASLSGDEAATNKKALHRLLEEIEVELVRNQIFHDKRRADGRALDEVRQITCETGVLPGTHGSAIFTRGETQSLGVITLGTGNDAQSVDDINGESDRRFYLHYNFLPYSVGEVRRYGGPGRREIGHGKLAENSLQAVIPDQKKFPYVIRAVSEILESNGSSSMATICSGSLAMMDAGVPIKAAVAGIAMGLITEGDKFAVLSDIAGLEDHFGDMDFKVAGTEKGITGFQMDLKVQGISAEIMEQALHQAKAGRLHILGEMKKTIEQPRGDLAAHAPRISTMKIDRDRIGELIGPGGKNIRAIIEKSGAEINVDDDGIVSIAATTGEASKIARDMIEGQFAEAEINAIYDGVVKGIVEFGAFIEILPGKQGLCHISKISDTRVAHVSDVLKEGQKVKVRVLAVDRMGKISLSIKDAPQD